MANILYEIVIYELRAPSKLLLGRTCAILVDKQRMKIETSSRNAFYFLSAWNVHQIGAKFTNMHR